jgi:RNA polymerase sigma-70 factor (ECF subfamily)
MDDSDDQELLERCRGGRDDDAFGELVDRYKNLVYGLVYRLSRDRNQADDLAQEVFLKIHRGLPYFRGDARLSTWIYRIVFNVCSQQRSRQHGAELPLERGDGRAPIDPGAVDAAFDDLELRDRLGKAMATLPDHYRFLVAAHYLKGVRYESLAEALAIPIGTVKTHLYRAKRMLRERLTGERADDL